MIHSMGVSSSDHPDGGVFPETPHSTLGPVKQIGSPMRFSETPVQMTRAGPRLGEHSAEVLREAGCSNDEIAAWTNAGVFK